MGSGGSAGSGTGNSRAAAQFAMPRFVWAASAACARVCMPMHARTHVWLGVHGWVGKIRGSKHVTQCGLCPSHARLPQPNLVHRASNAHCQQPAYSAQPNHTHPIARTLATTQPCTPSQQCPLSATALLSPTQPHSPPARRLLGSAGHVHPGRRSWCSALCPSGARHSRARRPAARQTIFFEGVRAERRVCVCTHARRQCATGCRCLTRCHEWFWPGDLRQEAHM